MAEARRIQALDYIISLHGRKLFGRTINFDALIVMSGIR